MSTLYQPSYHGDVGRFVFASSLPQYPSFALGSFLHIFGVGIDVFMSCDRQRNHTELTPLPIAMCPSDDGTATYIYFHSSYTCLRFRTPIPFMHDEPFALDPNNIMEVVTTLRSMELTKGVVMLEPSASNPYSSFSVVVHVPGGERVPVGTIRKEFRYGDKDLQDYITFMDQAVPANLRGKHGRPAEGWDDWGVVNLSPLYDMVVAREAAYQDDQKNWAFYMEKTSGGLHVHERSYRRTTANFDVSANFDGLLPWVPGTAPAVNCDSREYHSMLNLKVLAPVLRLFRYDNVYLRIPKYDMTYLTPVIHSTSFAGRVGMGGSFIFSQLPLQHESHEPHEPSKGAV